MNLNVDVSFTEIVFQLCERKNSESLQILLDKNENNEEILNLRDPSGQTPLYCAVASQSLGCVRVLLEHGADPNFSCSAAYFCRTPLHCCASEGCSVEIAELLLNHSAEPLLQDLHGDTCLVLANRYGHSDLFSLMTTAAEQRDQMFELIVNQFETLLLNGDCEAAKNCLIPIRNRRQTFLKHLSRRAHSLIIKCIERNLAESIIVLAENGVDCMTIIIEPNSDSVLHIAARFGADKVVRLVLERWPVLVSRQSALGRLPLHEACERGRANIVSILLSFSYPGSLIVTQQSPFGCYECPIDVNQVDSDCRSPLLDACASGNVDTVKALLNARFKAVGSSISTIPNFESPVNGQGTPVGSLSTYVSNLFRRMRVPSTNGSTTGTLPTSQSFQPGGVLSSSSRPVRSGSVISLEDKSVQLISDFEIVSPQPKPTSPGETYCPIDVNAFSYDRSTPLLTAIRIQNRPMVSVLLQSGADPELPANWRGYNITPLQAAVELRDADIVDILLQNGAIDADCSALEAALRSAPHLVPVFLRRWSEVDRDVQINVDSVAELAELSRCKTEQVVPVAINWRERPQLKELPQAWLVGCAIFHNPALLLDDFVACSVITRIDISSNAIKTLPSYLFHMQSLQSLNAASNQIDEIAAGGIQRSYLSSSLREIDLSCNRLPTIPAFIFWMKRLNKLYADNNVISTLPSDLWESTSIAELRLSHNRLESLPNKRVGRVHFDKLADSSHQQHKLSEIAIINTNSKQQRYRSSVSAEAKPADGEQQQNELQQHDLWSLELSSEIGVAADETLALGDSTGQGGGSGIRVLDLSYNFISTVPSSLVCLTPLLRTLNLSHNQLSVVPRWPSDFSPSLHTLDLSHNQINMFSRSVDDSSPLPCANPLPAVVNDGTFDGRTRSGSRPDSRRIRSRSCDRRKGGDAERRFVASCSHRQHVSLARLRTLVLSNNLLAAFPFDSPTAPGISQFDLSNNRITALPLAITHLQNLSVLNISNNFITTLPPELARLNRLWHLEITNCPLSGELGALARGKVRTAEIIYHLRAHLDRARLRPIMRLIVCGLPGSGKSSVIEAIKKAATNYTPPPSNQNFQNEPPQPLIDWGQLTVELRPDGPLTFRVCEVSGKADCRYVCSHFCTQRAVFLVVFNLSEQPVIQTVEKIALIVRNINSVAPSSSIVLVGSFADVLSESSSSSIAELGGVGDMVQLWQRKLSTALMPGDPSVALTSSNSSFSFNNSSFEVFDVSMNSDASLQNVDDSYLPGSGKIITVSSTKNRKKYGSVLLREAYRLAFEWRGGASSNSGNINRTTTPASNYQVPPTLKQMVPAIFADLEVVVAKIATGRFSSKLPPVLTAADFQAAVKQQLSELNMKSYRDLDELNQCVHFLHETGLVVHFDEPSVADIYFLSLQWLSRLLAEIIQKAAKSSSNGGLLALEEAAKVCKKLDRTGVISTEKLVSLLARLDAAFLCPGGTLLLVPGMLPSLENAGLMLHLKQVKRAHRTSFRMSVMDAAGTQLSTRSSFFGDSVETALPVDLNRFYLISYVPLSFWPRLMVKLMSCELLTEILSSISDAIGMAGENHPVLRCWETRIEILASDALPPCLIVEQVDRLHQKFLSQQRWSLSLNGQLLWSSGSSVSLISISIPGSVSPKMPSLRYRLMSLLTEAIDQLLEDWYPAIGSRFAQDTLGSYLVYRLVPCTQCFESQDLSMVPCFLLEECMAAICEVPQTTPSASESSPMLNPPLMCSKSHCFEVSLSAPDLLFADIPKSQLVDCAQFLDKASLLGCGALGPVIAVSLAKLQEQARKSAFVSSTSSAQTDPAFFPKSTGQFGQYSSKSVAIKFFNPVDIDLSSVAGPVTTASSLADQYRRLNEQLRRRFRADRVRLACEAYTSARQELSVLICLRHPHVVGLVGVSLRPLGLLLQLAPLGSLLDWLQSYRRVGQQLHSAIIVQVISQVADALAYIHSMGVVFRDIKSSNVLVWRFPRPTTGTITPNLLTDLVGSGGSGDPSSLNVQVRLSDFSISRWSGGIGCRGVAGTNGFMAPEIIQFNGEETYTEKVDCFSFGMLIYELLTLRLPFEDRPSVNARHAVLAGLRPQPTLSMFTYGQVFTDLIAACWRKDPDQRPSADEILRVSSWSGMSRVVSLSSVDGMPELLYTAPFPQSAGFRGALLARWYGEENRTRIDTIGFDGDECISVNTLAEHPPPESAPPRKNSFKNSSSKSDEQHQVVMITCLTLSSQLIFAADIAGLIHAYRLGCGEYLGCVPAGRTGCHAIALHCCNDVTSLDSPKSVHHPLAPQANEPASNDTLLALYSNSLFVVLSACASNNPVLAPVGRYELDPLKGTVCCMAVIRAHSYANAGYAAKSNKNKGDGVSSKVNLFEKKSSSTRIKSFFTRPTTISTSEQEKCGPGVSELWLGCFDGSILVCSAKSLSTPCRLRAPLLTNSTTSSQPPPIASLAVDASSESVFATLYLSSIVSRWGVRQRVLLAHFDFGEQITTVLPQPGRLLLGTVTGCIIQADLSTLRPTMSFPLHADSSLALLPVGSSEEQQQSGNDLVVSLGRGLSEPIATLLPQAAPTTRLCVVSLSFT